MSILHTRLTANRPNAIARDGTRPAVTSATPMETPGFAVTAHNQPAHSDLYYEALTPIIATDGAIIPAASAALPPDVIPAGRP